MSRSMRARGLKQTYLSQGVARLESRSMRARGLKRYRVAHDAHHIRSRSMRARGLKQSDFGNVLNPM